jgi:hypothetical protein
LSLNPYQNLALANTILMYFFLHSDHLKKSQTWQDHLQVLPRKTRSINTKNQKITLSQTRSHHLQSCFFQYFRLHQNQSEKPRPFQVGSWRNRDS